MKCLEGLEGIVHNPQQLMYTVDPQVQWNLELEVSHIACIGEFYRDSNQISLLQQARL